MSEDQLDTKTFWQQHQNLWPEFDSLAKINIELIRDTSTGNVINQIPPQQVIEKYRLGLMTANTAGMNARTPSFTPPTPVSLPTTNSK